jgi:hypothetical protein
MNCPAILPWKCKRQTLNEPAFGNFTELILSATTACGRYLPDFAGAEIGAGFVPSSTECEPVVR